MHLRYIGLTLIGFVVCKADIKCFSFGLGFDSSGSDSGYVLTLSGWIQPIFQKEIISKYFSSKKKRKWNWPLKSVYVFIYIQNQKR